MLLITNKKTGNSFEKQIRQSTLLFPPGNGKGKSFESFFL
jgi:hypothetical protein